jgi:hypothetical protein
MLKKIYPSGLTLFRQLATWRRFAVEDSGAILNLSNA